MPQEPQPDDRSNGTSQEDAPLPTASDSKVLDETARLAREGRKQLETDPNEPKPASE